MRAMQVMWQLTAMNLAAGAVGACGLLKPADAAYFHPLNDIDIT